MHPATMEWLILQAALKLLGSPLSEKCIDFNQLSDALAPNFHESIIALHLKKMEARQLLQLKQSDETLTSQNTNALKSDSIVFLAKIDSLLD